ncbi:hypothetical protein DENSPDRAFT_853318 [Dentipellis sp. KUC8613]|nr:hypothetical protein DENSPDRAFT_853318 [Dentipellis sp. KUC8613]
MVGLNGEDEMAVDPPVNLVLPASPTLLGDPMNVDELFMDVDPHVEHEGNDNGIPMDVDDVFVGGVEHDDAVPMEVDEMATREVGERGREWTLTIIIARSTLLHAHAHYAAAVDDIRPQPCRRPESLLTAEARQVVRHDITRRHDHEQDTRTAAYAGTARRKGEVQKHAVILSIANA